MPSSISIFHCTHGLCRMVGISIGRKKSSQKCSCSWSVQAKPPFWRHINWCMSFHSLGSRNPVLWTLSNCSLHLAVYLSVGWKSAGLVGNCSRFSKGSPLISQIIWNWLRSLVSIGWIFKATGLYCISFLQILWWVVSCFQRPHKAHNAVWLLRCC